jgi:hypothetical protein
MTRGDMRFIQEVAHTYQLLKIAHILATSHLAAMLSKLQKVHIHHTNLMDVIGVAVLVTKDSHGILGWSLSSA